MQHLCPYINTNTNIRLIGVDRGENYISAISQVEIANSDFMLVVG